jgi:hypothetical protein
MLPVIVTLLAAVAVFQLALAAGAPWGAAAWGGSHPGTLPTRFRVASAVAGLVVYPVIIAALLEVGGVLQARWIPRLGPTGLWILTGFFGLGAVGNVVSRSKVERWWGPVALLVALGCAALALDA